MTATTTALAWRDEVAAGVAGGERFAGLYAIARPDAAEVTALLASDAGVRPVTCRADRGTDGLPHVPSLVPVAPAAFWYERAAHDLSGVVADGHPRLDPLLLPLPEGAARPLPGGGATSAGPAVEHAGPVDVVGHVFTLPWGPVRSGVSESIEFLIETPGEDIPHLTIRPHHKHRGIAKQFEGRTLADGVLVAERVEGTSTVAHALAYTHAVEGLAGVVVPEPARLVRVLHAELERIAHHLDVTMRLADAAGLAVATARFGWHKELVQRLVARMSGSRFARGVVVPGGVRGAPGLAGPAVLSALDEVHARLRSDLAALEATPSFLDRLRGTGILSVDRARRFGAVGPIGRASGQDDDARAHRPTDAYDALPPVAPVTFETGDALARARVRWREVDASVALVHAAVEALARVADEPWRVAVPAVDGMAIGWSEAAPGEVLYALHVDGGRIRRCFARSPALHDLVLLHDVFRTDIFTDFPFIEASFGLSYAGVAM